MEIDGVELVQTSGACPEQYDAFIDGKLVGYLRLRHGHFEVSCPDAGGEVIYSAETAGDGIFSSEEREFQLKLAVLNIKTWHYYQLSEDGWNPVPMKYFNGW